jgi:ornithine carbamoyltransferase
MLSLEKSLLKLLIVDGRINIVKKIAAILLVGLMITSCVSCGNSNNNQNGTQNNAQSNTQNQTEQGNSTQSTDSKLNITSANELLTKVWNTYEDKDSDNNMYNDKFPILGGHFESYTEEAPGEYDLSKTADLERSFCFPADKIDLIDNAATMMHLMYANTFSASAYHVKDATKINEVAKSIQDCVMKNQWLDGDPEELLIMTVGDDYIVSVFGEEEQIEYFKAGIKTVYKDAVKIISQRDID